VVGCWRPDAPGHYPAAAYQTAFGALVLLQLPGLLWFVRRRAGNPVEWASHPSRL